MKVEILGEASGLGNATDLQKHNADQRLEERDVAMQNEDTTSVLAKRVAVANVALERCVREGIRK